MGIPLGTAPISNIEAMDYILFTKDNTTRRVEKEELKAFLESLDYCLDAGTANAYALTPTVPITSYVAGQVYKFKALNVNTGASTINISGVGVKNLVKSGNVALAAGDIPKDAIISAIYDGTNFQIIPDYATQLSDKASNTDNARTTTNKTVTGAINELNSNKATLTTTPQKTTADITYYVASTGSDTTGNGSSGLPFATVQKAINSLPQLINHSVTINVAIGTYNETVTISGFGGKGNISILGATTSTNTHNISAFVIKNCSIGVTLRGFNITTNNTNIYIENCISVNVNYCSIVGTSTGYNYGLDCYMSNVNASNNSISIRYGAIHSLLSSVYSNVNSGSGNTYGLLAESNGTIGKNGTQPSGTTVELQNGGGVIR